MMLTLATYLVALVVGFGIIAAGRKYPRVAFTIWLVAVAFVPMWCGVTVVYPLQPASAVGILLIGVLLFQTHRLFGFGDIVMAFFFVACLIPLVTGGSTILTIFVVLSQYLVGFLVGRLLPGVATFEWISTALTVVFGLVAVWALVEFAFRLHVYVDFGPSNSMHEQWGPIQERGGADRSEGAFGHSLALGACLAMAVPFALASKFRANVRLLISGVMVAGVVTTLSRMSMVCAVLALLGTVFFVRDERIVELRRRVVAMVAVGAVLAVPTVAAVFSAASSEAEASTTYRTSLTALLPDLSVLGMSPVAEVSPTGVLRFDGFRSIDNAVLLTGLTYGIIPTAIASLLVVAAIWLLVSGRATPAVVAMLAQVPAVIGVAFITQYAVFFWFGVGLAVASCTRAITSHNAAADLSWRMSSDPLPGAELVDTAADTGPAHGGLVHTADSTRRG